MNYINKYYIIHTYVALRYKVFEFEETILKATEILNPKGYSNKKECEDHLGEYLEKASPPYGLFRTYPYKQLPQWAQKEIKNYVKKNRSTE